ncbi:MAG: twin-arginine translocase subunit TatC [Arsenophonus sp.]
MSIDNHQPLISHLIELRRRILYSLFTVALVFFALVYFSNDIYTLVATPLINQLPSGSRMSATDVSSSFFTPIKLTLIVSVFISVPVILYQLWAFIAPALYKHERRVILPLLISSIVLFYLGILFAYFIVFPLAFNFFIKTTPESINFIPDITKYLSFVMTLFMAFGAAFEVPVSIILLCWTGITTLNSLKRKRPYIIVCSFIIGMFLTPPDIFSQTLFAIPMYLLFELGLLLSRLYFSNKPEGEKNKNSDMI